MIQKRALVLLNMGAARSKEELKEFLLNMFNDKNILTMKSDFFRSKLANYITNSRLDEAWGNYEKIGGKSPLHKTTKILVEKLQKELPNLFVIPVMRYTKPSAIDCINKLKDKDINDVILLPLYPQYSTTTTKSSCEDLMELCIKDFDIKILKPFYKEETLNDIICHEIINTIKDKDDYHLIFSAHGLPQKIIDSGDPYQTQVQEQVELIKQKLKEKDIKFKSISLAYQSKVGPMQWLTPSLDTALKQYKNEKVVIYPISFIIDNSETDFELRIEYKEIAKEFGIKKYKVCKCPNTDDRFIDFLVDIVSSK